MLTLKKIDKTNFELLAQAIWQIADSVMITDVNGVIQYVNNEFQNTTGYSEADVIGKTPRVVKSGLHTGGFYERMWGSLLAGRIFRDVIVNRRKNGQLFYEEKAITPLSDSDGRITHFISTGRDVTARVERQERIEHLAYHDPLTGLPNRALFMDRLRQALARAKRGETKIAVLYIDLDGFKEINDRHGHMLGDKFLRAMASRLLHGMRDSDTVARIGGDEFAVLIEDAEDAQSAITAADKLLGIIVRPVVRGSRSLIVSASLGVSLYPGHGSNAAELVRNADEAMYAAKTKGKNRVEVFSAA